MVMQIQGFTTVVCSYGLSFTGIKRCLIHLFSFGSNGAIRVCLKQLIREAYA